ncbi:hypothetical protein K461DRAFT_128246 [Myriangium duriaei CBS 260.36]|uniref:LYR motif-containing protein Cup1-like N-terminal domain-containing protein n=1 Tax=Myriangium duriaei CBS 260.36 TaxID=1168546 RepID=A0A9P4MP49_9PEZI|nr:hypothetical protein K461DRAFT_128246 [Myriangium duriaei CBS 260.36]
MRLSAVLQQANFQIKTTAVPKYVPTNEQTTTARHLLRALLREASYLPDANARAWVGNHVKSRFRAYSPDKIKSQPSDIDLRLQAQISKARKSLRQLRMANIGDKDGIERVLHHAYGRTGRRRHVLMSSLTKGDTPVDKIPLNEPTLNLAVMALLKSQVKTAPPEAARKNPKTLVRLKPDYNGKTIWLKPKTEDRLRKEVKAERSALLNMLQIPLPDDEYEFLRDVSLGSKRIGTIPKPRNRLPGVYATDRWLQGRDSEDMEEKFRSRNISTRFMQRRYAVVFAQCPQMAWNEDNKTWAVTWGKRELQSSVIRHATRDSPSLTSSG